MNNLISGKKIQIELSGTSVILKPDGSVEYETGKIKTVGIRNITEVLEHRINTIFDSRSHMVRFVNGGVLKYAYNGSGELIELSASNVAVVISEDGEFSFYVAGE